MKNLFLAVSLLYLINSLSGQGKINREKCNWKNVELVPYTDGLKSNEVVVGSGGLITEVRVTGFDDLSAKQLKEIKKTAKMFKSCKMYVDFDHKMLDKKLNPEITDEYLYVMAVLKAD